MANSDFSRHYQLDFKEIGLTGIDFCLEEWPTDHGRPAYSIFTIIFQYLMPVTIVSFAYMGEFLVSSSSRWSMVGLRESMQQRGT